MKKILTIICGLLLFTAVNAQFQHSGGIALRTGSSFMTAAAEQQTEEYSCPTCEAEVQAYIDNIAGLDETSVTAINTLVVSLKTDLEIDYLSEAFDIFYLLANKTETIALRNIVERDFDCTNSGSASWTQYQGFSGNGTSAYLNTNYNPYTDATNYTLNSASIGVYLRIGTAPLVNECPIGAGFSDGSTIGIVSTPSWYVYINDSTNNASNDPTGIYNGLYYLGRNTDVVNFRKNTTSVQAWSSSSPSEIPSLDLFLLAINGDGNATYFSNNQVSVVFAGKYFNEADYLIIQEAIENYMDTLGYGVF